MTRRALGLALVLALAACGPRFVRPGAGPARDPTPWVERLGALDRSPGRLRLAGRFRSGPLGSARFGAAVAEGEGLRLDAAAGPFGTAVLSLGCRGDRCLAYLPAERRAVELDSGGLWFAQILLGRVPRVGRPVGAWETPEGGTVLVFAGPDGWTEEVEWEPGADRPARARFLRDGRVEAELSWDGRVAGADFEYPSHIRLKLREPSADYVLEVERVEPAAQIDPELFGLRLPPGVRVERPEETEAWKPTRTPLWWRAPPG
ncbi:hypothetical protein [Deferrisoma palaeochoriense]